MIDKKYVKKEFLSNMKFWVKEEFSIKVAFIEKMSILDKKVVEKRFSSRRILGKKVLWNKKLAFNFISLSFQKCQSRS